MTQTVTVPGPAIGDEACVTGARRCRDEYPRQLAHLLLGVLGGLLILVLPREIAIEILAGALLVAFIIADALRDDPYEPTATGSFVGTFVRAHETPGAGANYTGLSVLAALVLFPGPAVAAGTIAFGVLDSVSTVAGLRYGRHRLANGKSLEGSIAAFAVTALVLLPFMTPAAAVTVAFVGTLAELVLRVNDNLVVPFLIALLATAFR